MKRILVASAVILLLAGCSASPKTAAVETPVEVPVVEVGTVEVPDLTGMAGDEAKKALKAAGLIVTWDAGEDTVLMSSNWSVIAQDPAAGAKVAEHAAVTVTVEKTPVEAAEPIAPVVEQSLKLQWGVESFTDGLLRDNGDQGMLNWFISSITDNGHGVVQVTVQVTAAETSKEEVLRLATSVMNLTCAEAPGMQWVEVMTADAKILQQTRRTSLCS